MPRVVVALIRASRPPTDLASGPDTHRTRLSSLRFLHSGNESGSFCACSTFSPGVADCSAAALTRLLGACRRPATFESGIGLIGRGTRISPRSGLLDVEL
jgi:hypothetical protein